MAIFLIPGLIMIALACLVYIQLHLSKAEEENKIKLDHDKSLCIDHQIQIALLKLVKYLTLTSNPTQHLGEFSCHLSFSSLCPGIDVH